MIFPNLIADPTVQVSDKVRINASKSFISTGEAAVSLVEIEPEAGEGFINVTSVDPNDWYLDWAYSGASRTVVSTVRVTTDGSPVTKTLSISVVTEADDDLFSKDSDILKLEFEILDLLPPGYSSFTYKHRKAKQAILDWFNEEGYRNFDGSKIVGADLVDHDEVRKWSEALALAFIYNDTSNSNDDKFMQKSQGYTSMAVDAKRRSVFELDLNKDGIIDQGELIRPTSLNMVRR